MTGDDVARPGLNTVETVVPRPPFPPCAGVSTARVKRVGRRHMRQALRPDHVKAVARAVTAPSGNDADPAAVIGKGLREHAIEGRKRLRLIWFRNVAVERDGHPLEVPVPRQIACLRPIEDCGGTHVALEAPACCPAPPRLCIQH